MLNQSPMIRIDFHSHSSVSADGWLTPLELVKASAAAGLDKIAITDHNEVSGALDAFALFPDRVIVGEEVQCKHGTHLIGLFLTGRIPSGLSVWETARRIRSQGGIVYAPHPYAYTHKANWHARQTMAVADIVEVFNSRAFLPSWNRLANEAAREYGIPSGAGSDSHTAKELGRAFTEMPGFSTVGEFRQALLQARPVGLMLGSPTLHVFSRAIAEVRRIVPSFGRRKVVRRKLKPATSPTRSADLPQSSASQPARPLGA